MSKIKSKISNTNPTIEQAVSMFMRRCKIKNLSDGTIKAYGEKLEVFRKYLHDDFLLTDLSSDTVDGFILWLRENTDNNDVSINSYLRHVRAFIYYLQDNGYVNDFKIHLIKADKPIKETYTDDKTSIHAFRHSFAKSWVMSGGDIFRLQKILGHSTLEVTKGYVNLFGQDLQQNYEQFNPLDRLTKQRIIVKKGR